VLTIFVACVASSHGAKLEQELVEELFRNYDPTIRPVTNYGDKVDVNLGFTPIRINNLDVDEGLLDINGWMMYTWTDSNLGWNTSEGSKYKDIADLKISVDRLWRPDLRIYNAMQMSLDEQLAIVTCNGTIMYVPPVTASVTCNTTARWFPFDRHACGIKVGSWTSDLSKINILAGTSMDTSLNDFHHNSDWHLEGMELSRHEKFYPCCPTAYPDVTATLFMRRKACKYILSSFIPLVALTLLALCTTIIPARNAEIRLLVVTLLTIAGSLHQRMAKISMPDSLTVMDIAMCQLLTIMAGLILCNCVHLAILKNHLHCSFLSKWMSTKPGSKEDVKSDSSEKNLIDAVTSEQAMQHKLIDRITVVPMTLYLAFVVIAFLSVPFGQ